MGDNDSGVIIVVVVVFVILLLLLVGGGAWWGCQDGGHNAASRNSAQRLCSSKKSRRSSSTDAVSVKTPLSNAYEHQLQTDLVQIEENLLTDAQTKLLHKLHKANTPMAQRNDQDPLRKQMTGVAPLRQQNYYHLNPNDGPKCAMPA